MNRRNFISLTAGSSLLLGLKLYGADGTLLRRANASSFAESLKPLGRRLELKDYYVWGSSPIAAPDGKIHVFFSMWPAQYGMGGWIHKSEIGHAVADSAEDEFKFVSTVFAPGGEGYWDGTTCHNPHIKEVDGKYCLFYMGNSNRKTDTKRIGLAIADNLYGPWQRPDAPLLDVSKAADAWDNHCTSNPSFVQHPNGQYWLYYKSWNTAEYENYDDPKIRGNRKYGLAIANDLEGPYERYEGNPIIDYSGLGNNIQAEDGFAWWQDGKFRMILRDMGIYNHQYGLYIESEDGIAWSTPEIAYYNTDHYFKQPPAPKHLSKYGRFERPQILFLGGKPSHLFLATQGGKYNTSSAFVFKIAGWKG